MNYPARKQLPEGVHVDLGQPTIVFLTVCTANRGRWLAFNDVHGLLVDIWTNATKWIVGRYVLMPDHVHLFAARGDSDFTFEAWVRYWKSQFIKRAKCDEWRWQSGHWDRRMRRDESYAEKWKYVRDNPVRAGLAEDSNGWPYQGELNQLRW